MCSQKVSVVICTLNREDSLKKLQASLARQTFIDFEVTVIDYEAPLVKCKNDGILRSSGEYILFLDDDVELAEDYIDTAVRILDGFPEIGGVSGYTVEQGEENRDSLRHKWFKPIYGYFFMGGCVRLPNSRTYKRVDFLEPSNYIVRKKFFYLTGGFASFEGVAEWSDVDFFYKVRELTSFYNCPSLFAIHRPIQDKVYEKRLKDIWHRYRNFERFAESNLRKTWKLEVYKIILRIYFWLKQRRLI